MCEVRLPAPSAAAVPEAWGARAGQLLWDALQVLCENFLGGAVRGSATQWMWSEGRDVSLAWPAALAAWPGALGCCAACWHHAALGPVCVA